ncbi:MAG: hypothetical protein R3F59_35210 [Myxococcota bacterium]
MQIDRGHRQDAVDDEVTVDDPDALAGAAETAVAPVEDVALVEVDVLGDLAEQVLEGPTGRWRPRRSRSGRRRRRSGMRRRR